MKLLKENMRGKRHGVGMDNDFLDMTLKAQATGTKIDK